MNLKELNKNIQIMWISMIIGRYIATNKNKPKEILDEEMSKIIKLYKKHINKDN
jgi:hypothetical protein